MKTFTEIFVAARDVSTPLITIRTADATSTIATIRATVKDAPIATWDAVTGLNGIGKDGQAAVTALLGNAGVEDQSATVAFPVALGVLRHVNPKSFRALSICATCTRRPVRCSST